MTFRAGVVCVLFLATACRGPRSATNESGESAGMADHRRAFLNGCAKKSLTSPEYCECAWDEFRNMFTEEEMNAKDVAPGKLEQYKSAVIGVCLNKLPEATVKRGYDKGCTSGRPELMTYCDCTWHELRKSFSPAELADEETVKGRRFHDAKGPAVKACAMHMPESYVADAFMKGCAKNPANQTFCDCAWKELRKYVTPAELEAEAYDQKEVFGKVEKVCGKYRPPK